ncbi:MULTISPECIES: DUF7661 family protein [Bordetella]|uniref:DUF7661 domain-containing protein n=1 Tax=Bordetella genomosp. 6 TaxID=463024 RepID=A0ABX4F7V3_9BORD|nr:MULTISPECIES: hypothetical protein [Bordetella]AOB24946.1 hypothetical protein BBB44_01015 [Bordetella bronchiseptica]AZW42179.1 hypothetical protein CWR61_01020 [Bordetella bronchiseptica]OZI70385.1 hypothetical protein CAL23_22720 [Bordetella genomosp. 6]
MKFDIYGRYQLDIVREGKAWVAYRSEAGKRARAYDIVIPAALAADQLAEYLDDLLHELAAPGRRITALSTAGG